MKPTEKTDLLTELQRAFEAAEEAEVHAPAGLAAQWVQLAKVRIAMAIEITEGIKE